MPEPLSSLTMPKSLDRSIILDIITRLGNRSKIVFTYDMSQQDNPYISIGTGMPSIVNDLMSEDVFAHVDFCQVGAFRASPARRRHPSKEQ